MNLLRHSNPPWNLFLLSEAMLNLSDHVEGHLIHGINPVFHWRAQVSKHMLPSERCHAICHWLVTLYSSVLVTGQSTIWWVIFFPLTPESVTITVYYHCGENVCSYSLQRTTTWFRILKWLFVKVSFNSSRIPSCEYQKLSRNSRGGNESQWPTTLTQAFISA